MSPPDLRAFVAVVVALFALACSSSSTIPLPRGWFRAEVRSPDGIAVPFLLYLPADRATPARMRSGSYELEAAIVDEPGQLRVHMPIFNTELVVRADLQGEVRLFTTFSGRVQLALAITPVASPSLAALREPTRSASPLDLAPTTYWRLRFADGSAGKLVLRAAAGGIDAIVSRDTGDVTYLGGAATNPLVLGGFDGTAAMRLDLQLVDQRVVAARWTAGQALDWREPLTITAAPRDFALPTRIRLESPGTRIELPELAAVMGKPVIVEIGASWCSSCHALAPILRALYRELHPQGLEIATLLYELSTDAAYNARQVARFKTGYQVPWPVVAIPGELGDIHIPGMPAADVGALPLLLFLDANHVLVATQLGFPMHAGDPDHATMLATLRTRARALLR